MIAYYVKNEAGDVHRLDASESLMFKVSDAELFGRLHVDGKCEIVIGWEQPSSLIVTDAPPSEDLTVGHAHTARFLGTDMSTLRSWRVVDVLMRYADKQRLTYMLGTYRILTMAEFNDRVQREQIRLIEYVMPDPETT